MDEMASGYRVVPKISGNMIGFFLVSNKSGEIRQVGLIECPHDNQMNDNVILADEVSKMYGKRLRRSV